MGQISIAESCARWVNFRLLLTVGRGRANPREVLEPSLSQLCKMSDVTDGRSACKIPTEKDEEEEPRWAADVTAFSGIWAVRELGFDRLGEFSDIDFLGEIDEVVVGTFSFGHTQLLVKWR